MQIISDLKQGFKLGINSLLYSFHRPKAQIFMATYILLPFMLYTLLALLITMLLPNALLSYENYITSRSINSAILKLFLYLIESFSSSFIKIFFTAALVRYLITNKNKLSSIFYDTYKIGFTIILLSGIKTLFIFIIMLLKDPTLNSKLPLLYDSIMIFTVIFIWLNKTLFSIIKESIQTFTQTLFILIGGGVPLLLTLASLPLSISFMFKQISFIPIIVTQATMLILLIPAATASIVFLVKAYQYNNAE
jgi:hypothetical protein